MTLLLKQLFSLIKLLNSDKGTHQIATGVVAGMILGFSPMLSLQSLLVFVCLFFFRIQIGAAFTTAFFFAIPAFLLDPVFHVIGSAILEIESLKEPFTTLYNMPIVPLTRFNNSVVMGAGVTAIVLAPVTFVASKKLIAAYRDKVVARFEKTKFWKAVKATAFYQWYVKYEELSGE
jgi:uncharacterized protein (TIGR03546 family)